MKIRNDFVTNSSSSSFILSFQEDEKDLTIEFAYQIILGFYKEYRKIVNEIFDFCNTKKDFRIGVKNNRLYCKDGKGRRIKENEEALSFLEKRFGFARYDLPDEGNLDSFYWIDSCPTYKDYLEYWTEKIYIKNESNYAPFSICDYTQETMDVLHYRNGEYDYEQEKMIYMNSPTIKIDKTLNNNELGWYYDCIEHYETKPCPNNCKFLNCKDYFYDMDLEKCKKVKEAKKANIKIENLPLQLLGRFAILSECGYIPSYVVNKLYNLCEYACNHMG